MEENKIRELTDDELTQVNGGYTQLVLQQSSRSPEFPQGVSPDLYVQMGEEWDKENVQRQFIDMPGEEGVGPTMGNPLASPLPEKGKFATLILEHF